jgi:transcriptional regulator with GAF, ATPase, and Fis domain
LSAADGDAELVRLRAELVRLVDEAREHGRLDALRAAFEELTAADTHAAAVDDDDADDGMGGEVGRYGMIGTSPKMRAVYELIAKVAPSDVAVLIHGETGTGKELVAHALHDHGPRARKPFLAENCAAVPPNLLESELFGHKRGAFTGAVVDRSGHFVAADGGTVFLDEIGDMPLEMQSKLLRVLQDGEVRAVGSNRSVHVDVRVLGATNKDLVAMCRAGTFREDLFYRLNVITITLPPLRERPGDVPLLARHILTGVAKEMGRAIELSPAALAALERWSWPGNVRELQNELQRAAVFAKGAIRVEDLSPRIAGSAA